jgi:hypothetical protein
MEPLLLHLLRLGRRVFQELGSSSKTRSTIHSWLNSLQKWKVFGKEWEIVRYPQLYKIDLNQTPRFRSPQPQINHGGCHFFTTPWAN